MVIWGHLGDIWGGLATHVPCTCWFLAACGWVVTCTCAVHVHGGCRACVRVCTYMTHTLACAWWVCTYTAYTAVYRHVHVCTCMYMTCAHPWCDTCVMYTHCTNGVRMVIWVSSGWVSIVHAQCTQRIQLYTAVYACVCICAVAIWWFACKHGCACPWRVCHNMSCCDMSHITYGTQPVCIHGTGSIELVCTCMYMYVHA